MIRQSAQVGPTARERFAQLYEEQLPRIFHYISYRVGNTALAEDLTSTVFEKALTAFPSYRPEKAPAEVWLLTIARNTLIDHFRKNGNRQFFPLESALSLSSDDPPPAEELEKQEELDRLRYCLTLLTQYEQEMVSLKFGTEITNRRIASMLGLSDSNVGTMLFRAIGKLRDCFQVWLDGKRK